jgi:hypothetical protein
MHDRPDAGGVLGDDGEQNHADGDVEKDRHGYRDVSKRVA